MRHSLNIRSVLPVGSCLLALALALPYATSQEPASTSPSTSMAAELQLPDLSVPSSATPEEAAAVNQKEPKPVAASQADKKSKEEPAAKPSEKSEPTGKKESAEKPNPTLSKEMTELRDRVRQALDVGYRFPFNTRDNTPSEIMDFCLAYGCFAEITDGASGQKLNGVGALCWNYPCGGYRLFIVDDNRVMPRVGYGLQRRPGQFLAFLALSMVNSDYELRVDNKRGTVADLVDYEKSTCRSGTNLAYQLIGLAYYLSEDDSWTDPSGATWSVERLVREELARTPDASTCDVTDRLMGLSFAVHRRIKRELPVEGVFLKAQEHLREYQQYALDLQNADGTWNAEFFAMKGNSSDLTGTLRATGRILEWLAFSLPEDQLQDPRVLRSVAYVAQLLTSRGASWNLRTMTPRDIDTVMSACQALSTYDQRVFRPLDPEKPAKDASQNASRPTPVKLNRFTAQL